jgi:hypothetical protein
MRKKNGTIDLPLDTIGKKNETIERSLSATDIPFKSDVNTQLTLRMYTFKNYHLSYSQVTTSLALGADNLLTVFIKPT